MFFVSYIKNFFNQLFQKLYAWLKRMWVVFDRYPKLFQSHPLLLQPCMTLLRKHTLLFQPCMTLKQKHTLLLQPCMPLQQKHTLLFQPCASLFQKHTLLQQKQNLLSETYKFLFPDLPGWAHRGVLFGLKNILSRQAGSAMFNHALALPKGYLLMNDMLNNKA